MKLRSHRRTALSLTEVLVAIFILAIGLMALMALFPIGALQMAQAMKDDRTATCAANADRQFRLFWKYAWLNGNGGLNPETIVQTLQPGIAALDNRDSGVTPGYLVPNATATPAGAGFTAATPVDPTSLTVPSMPVFLDPIGVALQQTINSNFWVGGITGAGAANSRYIARRDVMFPNSSGVPQAISQQPYSRLNFCSLLDDFTYNDVGRTGNPNYNPGTPGYFPVKREGDYNYGWMIQRLKNNIRFEVNLNVVVFRRRPATDVANQEYIYGVSANGNLLPNTAGLVFSSNSNIVTLNYNGARPPIKRGTWIMNASQYAVTEHSGALNGPTVDQYLRQFADFYRVVSVQESTTATGGAMDIEIQSPLKPLPQPGQIPGTNNYARFTNGRTWQVLIVMDNVTEVFDRGTISAFGTPAP